MINCVNCVKIILKIKENKTYNNIVEMQIKYQAIRKSQKSLLTGKQCCLKGEMVLLSLNRKQEEKQHKIKSEANWKGNNRNMERKRKGVH